MTFFSSGDNQFLTFAAESVATVAATWNLHRRLRGCDVVWFIDNEAAAAATIRGASREDDVNDFVQVAHLMWMYLGVRVWIEWVDSESNPSDGLSRLGLQDPWTVDQGWILSEALQPPWGGAPGNPDAMWAEVRRHWDTEVAANIG